MNTYINKRTKGLVISGATVLNASAGAGLEPMVMYQDMADGGLFVQREAEFNENHTPDGEAGDVLSRQGVVKSPLLDVLIGAAARLDRLTELVGIFREAMENSGIDDEGSTAQLLAESGGDAKEFLEELAVSRLHTPVILKVQRALSSNVENPPALVYNIDHSLTAELYLDDGVVSLFGEDYKMFVFARLWANGTLQIVNRVDEQGW